MSNHTSWICIVIIVCSWPSREWCEVLQIPVMHRPSPPAKLRRIESNSRISTFGTVLHARMQEKFWIFEFAPQIVTHVDWHARFKIIHGLDAARIKTLWHELAQSLFQQGSLRLVEGDNHDVLTRIRVRGTWLQPAIKMFKHSSPESIPCHQINAMDYRAWIAWTNINSKSCQWHSFQPKRHRCNLQHFCAIDLRGAHLTHKKSWIF